MLSSSGVAQALPLAELTAHVEPSVVHLLIRDARGEDESEGSGFVIASNGRVATNYHVIEGAEHMVALFPDKKEVLVTGVWAFDKEIDLAILQLAPGKYPALDLATEPARAGEDIVVIGSPLGLGNSVSTGVMSAIREKGLSERPFGEGSASWSLQFTAAAAPGSSGSPILRPNGEVIGILVGHLEGLDGAPFGIDVAKLRHIAATAPAEPRSLGEIAGARSVGRNLIISAGFFAGVAGLWAAGSKIARLRRRPRPSRSVSD